MTKKELSARFLVDTEKEKLLLEEYGNRLCSLITCWVKNRETCEAYLELAVKEFVKEYGKYYMETDCYIAIVGCMRDLVLEGLDKGKIPFEVCSSRLQTYYRERAMITEIPQKQVNIVLSEFSRKMFDYFMERYYYLRDEVGSNKKIEAKIAAHFLGKTDVKTLYIINHFRAASCGVGAYMHYLKNLDPLFVQQIGKTGFLQVHPVANEHYHIQRTANPARRALPIVVFLIVLLVIAAILSMNGIVDI